jgi:uncharacterized repeat protein (TIGR01451 family)
MKTRVKVSRFSPGFTTLVSLAVISGLSLLCAGEPRAATAGTITVCPAGPPTCDYETIQAALDGATDGDAILVGAGTYLENVNVNKSVTLQGAGPDSTIIDGNAAGPVLRLVDKPTVTINDLTITNGSGSGIYGFTGALMLNRCVLSHNHTESYGGAISLINYTLTLNDTTFVSNTCKYFGGGVTAFLSDVTIRNSHFISNTRGAIYHVDQSTLTISGSTFRDNTGLGGIFGTAPMTITDSTFDGNSADNEGGGVTAGARTMLKGCTFRDNSAGHGGGLSSRSTVTVVDCEFRDNRAVLGGGIYSTGILTLEDSTIGGNQADEDGGGIYGGLTMHRVSVVSNTAANNGGGIYSPGGGSMEYSEIRGNSAGQNGGGVFKEGGSSTIRNSTICHNDAGASGGGVMGVSWLYLTNVTISGNTAGEGGGGLYADPESQLGTVWLKNTTVAHNAAGADGAGIKNVSTNPYWTVSLDNSIIADNTPGGDCAGSFVSDGHNLASDDTCGFSATGDITATNPMLGSLAFNGGPLKTHALLTGSPAIDAGDPITPGGGGTACDAIDQRGVDRPQGFACDMGAYEAALTIVKTGPTRVTSGNNITYTLTVTNDSGVDVTNVIITDVLPADAHYASGGTLVGDVVGWTVASLAADETVARQFAVSASGTVNNSDYAVSAAGGHRVVGARAVVTVVEGAFRAVLPLVMRNH